MLKTTKNVNIPKLSADCPDEIRTLIELMNKEEDLIPELQQYRNPKIQGIQCPWFYDMNSGNGCYAHANHLYRKVQKALTKYREQKNYHGLISCYSKPYKLEGFIDEDIPTLADPKTYWEILADCWISTEFVWKNRDIRLIYLTLKNKSHREYLMLEEERESFNALPDQINIFRGFGGSRGKGLSWTTNKDKAIWFATRFCECTGKPGNLLEGTCNKSDMIAYFTRRGESEVVIDPKKVKSQRTNKSRRSIHP